MTLRDLNVVIIGCGIALTGRRDLPRKTPLQLSVEAAIGALKDAGVDRSDIGALFTGRAPQSYMTLQYNQSVLNELKLQPTFNSEVTSHGGGALGTLQLSAVALQCGAIDYALCVTSEASGLWLDQVTSNTSWEADLQFEAPYGPSTPSLYAQFASRYMHDYDITPEMCARVAVENRRWALDHPRAAMRDKGAITVQDVLSSPMIASPLRLLDCAVWYPGGIATAFVMTRGAQAATYKGEVTRFLGFGQCSTHEWVGEYFGQWNLDRVSGRNMSARTGASVAARQAYEMTGLEPTDIDLVQTSAPFSFANVMMLEELGFCGVGEGGEFVESGGIDYEGGLPLNTNGGYLSFGQVGQGLYNLYETIQQLHRRAEGRQVPSARYGMVHGHGGPLACHSVVIVSTDSD